MSTYAIGDIHGCRKQLELLLEHIKFDPAVDKLWFTGDLVNRGPDSLGTLRLVYSLRDSVISVLGNHDLHMLAVYAGGKKRHTKDNFYNIFNQVDTEELLEWLRFRPLVHVEDEFFLVHAGIYPFWNAIETQQYAREVETVLRGSEYKHFFKNMYGNKPDKWSSNLTGYDRLRFITNALTRMRYCYHNGALDMLFKGPVNEASDDLIPWFNLKHRVEHSGYILHGHWGALMGGELRPGIISLDTGCYWGYRFSAWCLEEKCWYSVEGYKKN